MTTVNATALKNRLGAVLKQAELAPVAIERHGRVVAYLVPPRTMAASATSRRAPTGHPRWTRGAEERVVALCASGDFRPSRWLRAGDPYLLAGVAAMLASQDDMDRNRLLGLAERLYPGMSTPEVFAGWLSTTPVHASRFLPMVRNRLRAAKLPAAPG
jgi:antitoxin (DNA-binding transcriptional repressor) of toxin-antitoxin stability system